MCSQVIALPVSAFLNSSAPLFRLTYLSSLLFSFFRFWTSSSPISLVNSLFLSPLTARHHLHLKNVSLPINLSIPAPDEYKFLLVLCNLDYMQVSSHHIRLPVAHILSIAFILPETNLPY